MKWFRFYSETVHDPKVQQLAPELFKTWVNLLCIASQQGGNLGGDEKALAFVLRMDQKKMSKHIQALKDAGLLDGDGDMRPHNWDGRQYESDNAAIRMKRHRQRKRDVTRDVTVTSNVRKSDVPDTDTDSEQSSVAKATAASGPRSDQDRLWQDGLPWLEKRSSRSPGALRSLVGKWARDHGATKVLEAIAKAQAESAVDPPAFVAACLGDKKSAEDKFVVRPLGIGG